MIGQAIAERDSEKTIYGQALVKNAKTTQAMEQVIYKGKTQDHVVEVSGDGSLRTLRFGTEERQTCIDLNNPADLQLSYTRWMMSALLLVPETQAFLVCGLGGGAIPHFLHHHFPKSHIDIVEKQAEVIEVSKKYFRLPCHHPLNIINQDAVDFISKPTEKLYDLAFIDLFDAQAMAPPLYVEEFYTGILQCMQPHGIMVINLWNGLDEVYTTACKAINKSCRGQMLEMAVKKRSNSIILAFSGDIPKDRLRAARKNLHHWQQQYQLPFHTYFKRLRRTNKTPRFSLL
ncbi:spermine/spermidine synthase domain-containing protein [Desulfogranum japonicum]|uniref:spermine/spermidine synthase domain-containing protein n=1 Tax=Desulfogranum japonicum TaxID=231447 RepID=UPI0003F5CD6F|nr:hypothetical protein [Desulfogranum japonicum]